MEERRNARRDALEATMGSRATGLWTLLALIALPAVPIMADGLGGSRASIVNQNEIAKAEDLTFLRTAADVRAFVAKERLVPIEPNADLVLHKVSFPYARPAVKLFVERLASQYRAAMGEPLVVTSVIRPTSRQPRNASPLSVHPAGIAVDFRIPAGSSQRSWLETTLLSLERHGVLDVTRERKPPHYHVAVFPDAYQRYADARIAAETEEAALAALAALAIEPAPAIAQPSLAPDTGTPGFTLPSAAVAMLGASALAVLVRWKTRSARQPVTL
jgi:hypothetical protein